MKYLCIDYGLKRIGLAKSDGLLASPIGVLPNHGFRKTILALKQHIKDNTTVIMGLPLHADGTDSDFAPTVREFAKLLAEEAGVPIVFVNEYMTSNMAEHHIRSTKTKESIDAVAACMILQSYLDNKGGFPNA
ncbi:MAG: Holliday junction resolvase RuvX [Firmicutes bacterium]|nr:Holliday junction resolvase RuvX [Bacillota bacterium]